MPRSFPRAPFSPPPLADSRSLLPIPVLLLGLGLSGCGAGPAPQATDDSTPVTVAATVPPLAWLAGAVGGDAVEVTAILPPGAHAEHHSPSPRRMIALDEAEVVLAVGHPALGFEARFLEPPRQAPAAARDDPDRQLRLTLADAAPRDALLAHDPHLWASPRLLAAATGPLAEALARRRPARAEDFRRRAVETRERLEALDRQLEERFAALPRRRFWVAHPAWGWLARDYGLEQVALEEHGREPSPADLVELLERARREGVEVIFVQQGASRRQARVLAEAIGARVETLDPLAADWPDNLLRVADALQQALETPTPSPEDRP